MFYCRRNVRLWVVLRLQDQVLVCLLLIELGHFAVLSVLLFRLWKGSVLRHEY